MTKKQYLAMKKAARRDAQKDQSGIGYKRIGDYAVVYSAYGGYNTYKSSIISTRRDFYNYVHSCRRLAQLDPTTAAQQLADCKAFLEVYKK